jgi:hypothetical protein
MDRVLIPPVLLQDDASAAARAIGAASAQIGLALQESQQPVAQLGSLIGQIAETLQALGTMPQLLGADAVTATSARGLLEQLQSDVWRGIGELQFYDRLVQHLTHLQDYLRTTAGSLAGQPAIDAAHGSWSGINASLRNRLISSRQRELFDLSLHAGSVEPGGSTGAPGELADPGSTELF